ncbi:MAG: hypothetical protein FWE52_00300 [Alphaproteobacteria bacterium]|nr:hypothetical protein [Alphaproteobacteria bacterium]
MRKYILSAALCACTVPGMAATYYQGGTFQSPQTAYSATGPSPMSAQRPMTPVQSNRVAQNQFQQQQQQRVFQTQVPRQQPAPAPATKSDTGFELFGSLTHEIARWQFDMKTAGSKLHYDNIAWNVLDVGGRYKFNTGNMGLSIEGGVKYGMQFGESTMVDDDISNGGYLSNFFYEEVNGIPGFQPGEDQFIGNIYSKALSIGKSSGGTMFGYNLGIGMTDTFKIGSARLTPSIGWRSFSYKLKTNKNNGISIETGKCITVPGSNETQCNPLIIVITDGGMEVLWDTNETTGGFVDTGNTYFYSQPGTSHKYEVDWSGPYLALDLDYDINVNNSVNARVELGLPAYTATGDQPYRPDWNHPKSVEDKAGIGSAYRLGFLANWQTAITDSVALTLGLTYDYYTVSGADAKTFLNGNYFTNMFFDIVNSQYQDGTFVFPGASQAERQQFALGNNTFDAVQSAMVNELHSILDLEDACPGWVCRAKGEIDSFYRSMGIRVGFSARF